MSSIFQTKEPNLSDQLKDISVGKIQLPDFQRSWVWDDAEIRSLIASVSLSYPIGAIMLLQQGGDGAQFQPRPLEGVQLNDKVHPEYLILDGQQRMTSLFLALLSGKPIPTKTPQGRPTERVYYLDIARCLNEAEDRVNAVVSLKPERRIIEDFGRRVVLDVSTPEKEYEQGMYPLDTLLVGTRHIRWRQGYASRFHDVPTRLGQIERFENEIFLPVQAYRIPTIELARETPKEAVCQVFEKVNTGGVKLTVFELVTAMFAADNFNLRENWNARKERLAEYEVLKEEEDGRSGFDAAAFLTAVTLLSTYERHRRSKAAPVACKRRDVLALTLTDYERYADVVEKGLQHAARFLRREKVFDKDTLPYSTQIIPLCVICAILGDRFEDDVIRRKLAQWYWCGVFGELYGGANETRFAFDVPEVIGWFEGHELPRTIRDAAFSPTRLLGMQTRNSAAYKGLMCLLMKKGAADFISGDPIEFSTYFDLNIDIHHIFPKAYCERNGFERRIWNSSINKTPLSSRTNRKFGGRAPSRYLGTIENNGMAAERLDQIVRTHYIDPSVLRSDAFYEFILNRAANLLDLIGSAMGKEITGRDSEEVVAELGASLR